MNPFQSVLFFLFSPCVSVATLALGVWKVFVLSSSSVSSAFKVVLILSVRVFCVRISNFLVLFLSYGRGDYSVLNAPLFLLHRFPSFQLSLVNLSYILCFVSFSVISHLLRYSLSLRARSHNFSGELCSALLVFSTHFLLCPSLLLFSNICRASVQLYCTSNTLVFHFLLQQTTTFI